jgi:hypothetical protein
VQSRAGLPQHACLAACAEGRHLRALQQVTMEMYRSRNDT